MKDQATLHLSTPAPCRWPTVCIEDACTLVTDGTHQTPVYSEEGVIFLSAKNVASGKIDWEDVKRIPPSLHAQLHKRLAPQKGDLLLAKNGTTGVAAVVDRDTVFDIYVSLALLRPKSEVLPEYLHRALNSPDTKSQFSGSLKGIGVPNLHLKDIRRAVIPLPPLAEQRRIAEVLDRAEALRAKRRAALAQLDSLTQSIFLTLITSAGADLRMERIEDAMEAIIDYRGKSPAKTASGVPLVTARVVKGGELLEPNEFIAEEAYDEWMRRGFPKAGDVLFTTEAPLGEVAQLDGRKIALAQRLLVLRGKPTLLDNAFLKHVLTSAEVRKQIDARATGSTVRGIRQRELRQVRLPIPPMSLQREFARRVAAVEKLKAAQRASLAELDAFFASLQHRAFRGEL